jgi:hypothetical protein
VPDRRGDGEPHSVGIELPPGRASPDPATAAYCRMARDPIRAAGGTARELLEDCGGELGLEPHILIGPSRPVPLPAAGTHLSIG